MKSLLIALVLTFILPSNTNAQVAQSENMFDRVIAIIDTFPDKKPTIMYSYVTWCGALGKDWDEIFPVLNAHRTQFNFILLADTTKSKYKTLFDKIKPDALIPMNSYFKNCLRSRKEGKVALKQYNKAFNQTLSIYGGAGGLFLFNSDKQLIKLFGIKNRAEDLSLYFKD